MRTSPLLYAALGLAACTPTEAPDAPEPVPSYEAESGESAVNSAEAEEVEVRVSATACADARELLIRPPSPEPSTVDLEAARADLNSAALDIPLRRIQSLGETGSAAIPLVADLEGMLGSSDLARSNAILNALVGISPEDALRVGAFVAGNGNRMLPERHMGASALAKLGPEGMERIAELYLNATSELEQSIALSGVSRARAYPIAARDVLFGASGVCLRHADQPECLALYRELSLVWADLSPRNDAASALVDAEREAVLSGTVTETWREAFEPAYMLSSATAIQSLSRLQSMGPVDGLIVPALRVVSSGRSSMPERREQLLWLVNAGPHLEAHLPAIRERCAALEGEPLAGLVGIVAVAAGAEELPASTLDSIVAIASNGRSAMTTAAAVAAIRLGRGEDVLRAIAEGTRPAGFNEVTAAVALEDPNAFLEAIRTEAIPMAVAAEAASIWSGGRRDEVAAAIATLVPDGRLVEVAARAATPSPDIANVLSEFAADSSLSPPVAWLFHASGDDARLIEVATANVTGGTSSRRRRAVQWATVAGHALEVDALMESLSAPLARNEVETRGARAPVLYQLLSRDISLNDALEAVVSNQSVGPGTTERSLLLANAYHASCPESE